MLLRDFEVCNRFGLYDWIKYSNYESRNPAVIKTEGLEKRQKEFWAFVERLIAAPPLRKRSKPRAIGAKHFLSK